MEASPLYKKNLLEPESPVLSHPFCFEASARKVFEAQLKDKLKYYFSLQAKLEFRQIVFDC